MIDNIILNSDVGTTGTSADSPLELVSDSKLEPAASYGFNSITPLGVEQSTPFGVNTIYNTVELSIEESLSKLDELSKNIIEISKITRDYGEYNEISILNEFFASNQGAYMYINDLANSINGTFKYLSGIIKENDTLYASKFELTAKNLDLMLSSITQSKGYIDNKISTLNMSAEALRLEFKDSIAYNNGLYEEFVNTKISTAKSDITTILAREFNNYDKSVKEQYTTIEQFSNQIRLLASATELNNIGTIVGQHSASINILSNQISSKVSYLDFSSLQGNLQGVINNHQSLVTDVNNLVTVVNKATSDIAIVNTLLQNNGINTGIIGDLSTQLTDVKNAYNQLKNDYTGISGTVSANSSSITQLANSITSKVNQIDFDLSNSTIASHTSLIAQLSNSIDLKVAKTDFDLLANTVNQNSSSINVLSNSITNKVSQLNFDAYTQTVTSRFSTVEQTASRWSILLNEDNSLKASFVVDSINNGTVLINANKIKIGGTTVFENNYDPSKKVQVFRILPSPPYYKNDVYMEAGGDIWICIKPNATQFLASDWELATKYTGDDAINNFIHGQYATDKIALEGKLDGKTETFYQNTLPYPEYTNISNNDDYNKKVGDLWYNNDPAVKKTYRYTKSANGANWDYKWVYQEVPKEIFDTIDGKRTVYNVKPTTYKVRDLMILDADFTDGTTTFIANRLYKASNNSASWNKAHWSEIGYTDDTALTQFLSGTYSTDKQGLQNQIDGKSETYYQTSMPYPEKTNVTATLVDDNRVNDLWYNSDVNVKKTYRYSKVANGSNWDYKWLYMDVPKSVFDAIDGKRTIFNTKPSSYSARDLLIPNETFIEGIVTFYANKIYKANRNNSVFDVTDWSAMAYTDDTTIVNFINNTYNPKISNIETAIDGKINTYYQSSVPYNNKLNSPADATYDKYIGDVWYNNDPLVKKTYMFVREANGSNWDYKWKDQEVPTEVFDFIDGKSTIFVIKPSNYDVGDLWIVESDNAIIGYKKGELLTANTDSVTFNADHWSKKVNYTNDDTVLDFISNQYANDKLALEGKIDGKIDSFYQTTLPHPEYTNIANNVDYNKFIGDMWYNSDVNVKKTYRYTKIANGSNWNYTWVQQEIPKDIFDTLDGKRSIFNVKPASYRTRDLMILDANFTDSGTVFIANRIYKSSADSTTWNKTHWSEIGYTDDTALVTFLSGAYVTDKQGLQSQIDGKSETFYQTTAPYAEKINVVASAIDDNRVNDLWYNNDPTLNKTFRYTKIANGSNWDYKWVFLDVPKTVFDAIDGKKTIYNTKPTSYSTRDLLIPNVTFTDNGVTFTANKIYKATKDSLVFNAADWVGMQYTDDTAVTNFITTVYTPKIANIEGALDGKINSYYQSTKPYNDRINLPSDANYDKLVGDVWYNNTPSIRKSYMFVKEANGSNWNYSWKEQEVPKEIFDTIDGKSSIYTTKPTAYDVDDIWILESSTVMAGYAIGDVLTATVKSSTFNSAHWTKKIRYTDDTAVSNFITNVYAVDKLNFQNQIDGKSDTYYQSTMPYAEVINVAASTANDIRVNDLWYNTDPNSNKTYRYSKVPNGSNFNYIWDYVKAPKEIFDSIDGKRTIYSIKPSTYNARDILIPNAEFVDNGKTFRANKLYKALNDNSSFVSTDWIELAYTDDTEAFKKSTRFVGGTDPSNSWIDNTTKYMHLNDTWVTETNADGLHPSNTIDQKYEYVWTEKSTGVFGWVLNQVIINGGSIEAGTITVDKLDINGLFAKELTANNFNLVGGKIGAFSVDNSVISNINNGNRFVIDGLNQEIYMTSQAGNIVTIRNSALTPLALIPNSTIKIMGVNRNECADYMLFSRNDVVSPKSTLYYIGKTTGSNETYLTRSILSSSNKYYINGGTGTQTSIDLPFSIAIKHNGKTSDGRVNKLIGTSSITVTAVLKTDNNANCYTFTKSYSNYYDTNDLSDKIIGDTIRTNFNIVGNRYLWWEFTITIGGDLKYQYFNHSTWVSSSWWTSMNSEPIMYALSTNAGFQILSAVGMTEVSSTGIQSYWTDQRYIRIDGNVNNNTFIESKGVWYHNGKEVKFDSTTITNYVDTNIFATKNYLDTGFLKLNGGTINGDITINGNLYLQAAGKYIVSEQVYSENDFITLRYNNPVNLANGTFTGFKANRVFSDGTDGYLVYGNDGMARVGKLASLQMIATREDNPLEGGIAVWVGANKRFEAKNNLNVLGSITSNNRPVFLHGVEGVIDYNNLNTFFTNNSGIYTVSYVGNTGILLNFNKASGSASAMQIEAMFSDVAPRFRMAVDNNRFTDWYRFYTKGNANLSTVNWTAGTVTTNQKDDNTNSINILPVGGGSAWYLKLDNVASANNLHIGSDKYIRINKTTGRIYTVNGTYEVWDAGNSNLNSTPWNCSVLTAGSAIISGTVTGMSAILSNASLTDANSTITGNLPMGMRFDRGSSGFLNTPFNANNANGLLTLTSHSTGGTGTYGKQIFFTDSEELYIRRFTNGIPSGWRSIYHTNNANLSTIDWNVKNLIIGGTNITFPTQAGKTPYIGQYTADGSLIISIEGTGTDKGLVLGGTSGNLLYKSNNVWHSGNSNLSTVNWNVNNLYSKYIDVTGGTGLIQESGLINFQSSRARLGYDGTTQNMIIRTADNSKNIVFSLNIDGSIEKAKITNDGFVVNGVVKSYDQNGSGFTASGWLLAETSNFNNIDVRGRLQVYEFVQNKISILNGNAIISDNAKSISVDKQISTGKHVRYFFKEACPFIVGDIVRVKTPTKDFTERVDDVSADKLSIAFFSVSDYVYDSVSADDLIVRWNSEDANRKGLLYLNSSDTNAPNFQVIYNGQVKGNFGNCTGLNWQGNALPANSWGVWIDNGWFNGSINATAGNIAAWDISNTQITGSDGNYTIGIGKSYGIHNWKNSNSIYNWKFNIDGSGILSKGAISWDANGNLVANSGIFGGFTIDNYQLHSGTNSAGLTPKIRLSNSNVTTGDGYIYRGNRILEGLSLTWLRTSNAGHLVFGQLASNGNTLKDGFKGIQMMDWTGNEYFALGANVNVENNSSHYCKIAGWNFDTLSIHKGSRWGLNARGVGMYSESNFSVISAHKDNNNYVALFDNGGMQGLDAVYGGSSIFRITDSQKYIAGWNFDNYHLYSGYISINANGTIEHTSGKWKLSNDGSGKVANGNIEWFADGSTNIAGQNIKVAANGDITFSDKVKMQWQTKGDNLLGKHSKWIEGSSQINIFDIGTSTPNGLSTNNIFEVATLTSSKFAYALRCKGDNINAGNGGWNCQVPNIDTTYGYRYAVWMWFNNTNGSVYLGFDQNGNIGNLSGIVNTNPYAIVLSCSEPSIRGKWLLFVGNIHSNFDTSTTNSSDSGVYDINGNKLFGGTDFKWLTNSRSLTAGFRSYLYYSNDNNYCYFYNPQLYKLDGTEPNITDMIDSFIGRSRLTNITSSGVYTGTLTAEQILATNFKAKTANIEDGAITNAKIQNLDVNKLTGNEIKGKTFLAVDNNNSNILTISGISGLIETYDANKLALRISKGDITFYDSLNVPSLFLKNTVVDSSTFTGTNFSLAAITNILRSDNNYTDNFTITSSNLGVYDLTVYFSYTATITFQEFLSAYGYAASGYVNINIILEKQNNDATWSHVSYITGHNYNYTNYTRTLNFSNSMVKVKGGYTFTQTGVYRLRISYSVSGWCTVNVSDPHNIDPEGNLVEVDIASIVTTCSNNTVYDFVNVRNGTFIGTNGIYIYNKVGEQSKTFIVDSKIGGAYSPLITTNGGLSANYLSYTFDIDYDGIHIKYGTVDYLLLASDGLYLKNVPNAVSWATTRRLYVDSTGKLYKSPNNGS